MASLEPQLVCRLNILILEAIANLKEPTGSDRAAIAAYIEVLFFFILLQDSKKLLSTSTWTSKWLLCQTERWLERTLHFPQISSRRAITLYYLFSSTIGLVCVSWKAVHEGLCPGRQKMQLAVASCLLVFMSSFSRFYVKSSFISPPNPTSNYLDLGPSYYIIVSLSCHWQIIHVLRPYINYIHWYGEFIIV